MTADLDEQPQPPEDLALASLFDAAGRDDWRTAVAAVLRKSGALARDAPADGAEALLATRTYEGIDVQALYTADDAPGEAGPPGTAPFTRGATAPGAGDAGTEGGWDVRQRHAHPDPERARAAIMTDLENGVTSVWLAVGRGGVPLGSLDAVLADVYLDLAPVVLDAGPDTAAAAAEYLDVVRSRGVIPAEVGGNLGADPIGLRARLGSQVDVAAGLEELTGLATRCVADFPGIRPAVVDATAYHEAGGSDADELGASIATGLAYLRALTGAGLDLATAFRQLEFRYAAGADQFLTIAKFRAARRLWARVAEVCGVPEPAPQRQHAVTSGAMMSRRDPWVNILRTTLACFGAGVGGAASVTVQPFDAALGLPDDLSRRIARNTSSLLMMESHLARVIDPAGGSWYVERLTDELAVKAWAWFTEIERAGGILAALDSGLVAGRLDDVWARRSANLAHRRDPLTGVSEFPNLTEKLPAREADPESAIALGVTVEPAAGALPVRRYAAAFEALRDAADAAPGDRPAVFLASLGPASAFTARATFAANLFQAGGLATPDGGGGTDPAVIAAAFSASGAKLACLASSDKVYAEHAAPVAAALKAAGAQVIWLAGKPGERAESDAAAGIDGYVYAGVDALEVLARAHAELGIAPVTG